MEPDGLMTKSYSPEAEELGKLTFYKPIHYLKGKLPHGTSPLHKKTRVCTIKPPARPTLSRLGSQQSVGLAGDADNPHPVSQVRNSGSGQQSRGWAVNPGGLAPGPMCPPPPHPAFKLTLLLIPFSFPSTLPEASVTFPRREKSYYPNKAGKKIYSEKQTNHSP